MEDDNLLLLVPSHLANQYGHASRAALTIIASLLCIIVMVQVLRNQLHPRARLIPGVLIVGGSDTASIKRSSLEFVTNSKEMLIEGYAQVTNRPRAPPISPR